MKNVYALKFFLKALLLVVGLLAAGWLFIPWQQAGETIMLSASSRLQEPASLAYSTVRSAKRGFVVNNLDVKNIMGLLNVSFSSVTIIPDVAATILGMTPTCRISFTGAVIGDIAITPKNTMPGATLGNGRLGISISKQGIFIDGLRSDGELSMSGSILINPLEKKIVWGDVAIDVKSEGFEKNLTMVGSVFSLPLQQDGPGRWSIRRQKE